MTPDPADTRRAVAILAAIGLVAAVWCLADLARTDRLPAYRDLLPFVLPYRAFLGAHLLRGDVPFWDPYVALGVPFAASLHASVFYPPSLILLVPPPLGFNLFLLAHFAIAAIGSYAWLRQREASHGGAVAGAIVFTLGGYLVASVTNTAHLQAAVWAPMIFLAWSRACRGAGGFVRTAVLLVVQLLGGAPEVWVATVGALGAWTLFASAPEARSRASSTARLAACTALSFGLAAFQLAPTFEYLGLSRRAGELSRAELGYWSMEPTAILELLFPPSLELAGPAERGTLGAVLVTNLPLVHTIYLGIAGLVLAVVGAVRGRERAFWIGIAAAGIGIALGEHFVIRPALALVVGPLIERMRYPEKFLFLFHLAAAVLVAHGATAAFRGERPALRVVVVAALTLGAFALALAMLGWTAPERLLRFAAILSARPEWPEAAFRTVAADLAYKAERALAVLAALVLLAGLRARARVGTGLFAGLVVALLAGDLASTHRNLWVSMPAREIDAATPEVDVAELRAENRRIFHYRTTVSGGFAAPGLARWTPLIDDRTDLRAFALGSRRLLLLATGMLHGVGNLAASDSIGDPVGLLAALARLPRAQAIDLAGAFSVTRLIGPDELDAPNVELLPANGARVYRIPAALPFAYLAAELEAVADEVTSLARLADPAFPRGRRAIVERLPEGWRGSPAPSEAAESVEVERAGPDELAISFSASGPRLLVVNQAFFPGWAAELDGVATEILRANALVQGVVVPEGDHRLRLVYRPSSFRVGVTLSVVSLVAVVIGIALARRSVG